MEHKCEKNREIDLIIKKIDRMDEKLDDLMSWKFKLVGGSLVVIFVVSVLFKTKLF